MLTVWRTEYKTVYSPISILTEKYDGFLIRKQQKNLTNSVSHWFNIIPILHLKQKFLRTIVINKKGKTYQKEAAHLEWT